MATAHILKPSKPSTERNFIAKSLLKWASNDNTNNWQVTVKDFEPQCLPSNVLHVLEKHRPKTQGFTLHFGNSRDLHIKRQCWLKREMKNIRTANLVGCNLSMTMGVHDLQLRRRWLFHCCWTAEDAVHLESRKRFGYRAKPSLKYPVHFRGSLTQCSLSRRQSATVGLPSPFVGWFMGLAAWILPGSPNSGDHFNTPWLLHVSAGVYNIEPDKPGAEVSKEGLTCSKEKNWPIGGAFKRICCWDVFGRQWRKSIVLTSLGLFWFWKPSSWMGWFKVSYQLLKRLIKLFNKIFFFACLQNRMLPAL